MPVQNPKELFIRLLSDLRQGTERSIKFYQNSASSRGSRRKEALEARAFVAEQVLDTQDQCFKLIGEKPTMGTSRLQDIFIEDFRKELAEMQNPAAKVLFILVKANHLTHLLFAEYVALIATAI